MADEKKTCFIIMPITTPESFVEKYRDGSEHFIHVLDCLFIPSVEAAGFEAITPIAKGSDLIHAEIIRNLEQSDLVLCDMSCLNPNVFFEFGIRTSLNKPVCVVKDDLTKNIPFDTGILNHQEYISTLDTWEINNEIKKLVKHIQTSEERSKGENKLWKYFAFRTEAKPYSGDAGNDDKFEYLSMQMDSLRQQINEIQAPTALDIVKKDKSIIDNVLDEVKTFLRLQGVQRIDFNILSDKEMVFKYAGKIDIKQVRNIQNGIKNNYGVFVRFIQLSAK